MDREVEMRPQLERQRLPARKLVDMPAKRFGKLRPLDSKQQVMPAILVSDLGDDFGVVGIVARRIERSDPRDSRLGEGVDLCVQVAVIERRRLVEMEPAIEAMRLEHCDDGIVRSRAARVRLQHEGHADTAVACTDQGGGKRAVPEIIGGPVDAASRRRCVDLVLQQIAQPAWRQVGPAELDPPELAPVQGSAPRQQRRQRRQDALHA